MRCAPLRCLLPTLAFGLLLSSAAAAEVQGELAVANDYVRRGFSMSTADAVVQAGVNFRGQRGLIAGIWGSTVDFYLDNAKHDRVDVEFRAHAGYAYALSESWTGSSLLLRYEYPGLKGPLDISYSELSFSALFLDVFQASISYSDSYFGSPLSGAFLETSWRTPLPLGLDLELGAGVADLSRGVDFAYGHVALSRSFSHLTLDLGYYFSDAPPIPRWGEAIDSRWVFGVSTRLP